MTDSKTTNHRIKIDPLTNRPPVIWLSWWLLVGSASLYASILTPHVLAATGAVSSSPSYALMALLLIPIAVFWSYGALTTQRTLRFEEVASRSAGYGHAESFVHGLRRIEARALADAGTLGISSRVELRYREGDDTIATIATPRRHYIVIGLEWAYKVHNRDKLEFRNTLRSMILHEMGHVLGRDVFVLGALNLYLLGAFLALVHSLLVSMLGRAEASLLHPAYYWLALAFLIFPHSYISRRRESFADKVSLRIYNVSHSLESALSDSVGSPAPPAVHGISGVLARRFSKNPLPHKTSQGPLARLLALLDHHFDATRRINQIQSCAGADDDLHTADYLALGVAAGTTTWMIWLFLETISVPQSMTNWAISGAEAIGLFISFKLVAENTLLARGVPDRAVWNAAAYTVATAFPALISALAFDNIHSTIGIKEVVALAKYPGGVLLTFIFFSKQANLLTFTRSVGRARIGSGVLAGMSAIIGLSGIAGLLNHFVFRHVVTLATRTILGPLSCAWKCDECNAMNDGRPISAPQNYFDSWGADVCAHCERCGTFALGPLFFPVTSKPNVSARRTPTPPVRPVATTHDIVGDIAQRLNDERIARVSNVGGLTPDDLRVTFGWGGVGVAIAIMSGHCMLRSEPKDATSSESMGTFEPSVVPHRPTYDTLPNNRALVHANVDGARVFVDGFFQCTTPCEIMTPVGDGLAHEIRLEKEGYADVQRDWSPRSVGDRLPMLQMKELVTVPEAALPPARSAAQKP